MSGAFIIKGSCAPLMPSTAVILWFRAPSDQPVLAIWLLQPGVYEIYMENFWDKVSIEEFVIETMKDLFSGNHRDLYEEVAKDPSAAGTPGFWNRLKKMFS